MSGWCGVHAWRIFSAYLCNDYVIDRCRCAASRDGMAGNGPLFFPGNSCKSLLCENCELRFNSYQSIINVTSPQLPSKTSAMVVNMKMHCIIILLYICMLGYCLWTWIAHY